MYNTFCESNSIKHNKYTLSISEWLSHLFKRKHFFAQITSISFTNACTLLKSFKNICIKEYLSEIGSLCLKIKANMKI